MSYEPTTWKTGDVITANKLNKIEQGIAAIGDTPVVTDHPIMVVNATMSGTTMTLGNTWQEIHDAFEAGKLVLIICKEEEFETFLYVVGTHPNNYGVSACSTQSAAFTPFAASSASGYPSYDTSGGGETPK